MGNKLHDDDSYERSKNRYISLHVRFLSQVVNVKFLGFHDPSEVCLAGVSCYLAIGRTLSDFLFSRFSSFGVEFLSQGV